jgi:hypothetical protein
LDLEKNVATHITKLIALSQKQRRISAERAIFVDSISSAPNANCKPLALTAPVAMSNFAKVKKNITTAAKEKAVAKT